MLVTVFTLYHLVLPNIKKTHNRLQFEYKKRLNSLYYTLNKFYFQFKKVININLLCYFYIKLILLI
jgi:hypothetical protein